MLKHWLALTLFLRVAGAPLDNKTSAVFDEGIIDEAELVGASHLDVHGRQVLPRDVVG